MRTSGLPCRANTDCETVFSPSQQDSMEAPRSAPPSPAQPRAEPVSDRAGREAVEALREAASRRDAHELEVHEYRHVATTTLSGASTFAQGPAGRRGRGRERAEELDVI